MLKVRIYWVQGTYYYTLQEIDDEFYWGLQGIGGFDSWNSLDKQTLFDFVGRARSQVNALA